MARITWDALGERIYEIGVDRGVFYPLVGGVYTNGIAWNGLTGVSDDNGGREATKLYTGGIKADVEYTPDEYSGKIRCYTYPDEFEPYLGVTELRHGLFARQQDRSMFGFTYRSIVGNDTDGRDFGYKIHLLYNCLVNDFSRSYSSVNGNLDVGQTEISFETFPQDMGDDEYKPASELIIDSRSMKDTTLELLETILYGDEENAPRLPFPDELMDLMNEPYPIPPEWYLYPNPLIYPAGSLYPEEQEG